MVTGASGFVGRQIVKALLKKNCCIVTTVRDHEKNRKVEQASQCATIGVQDLFTATSASLVAALEKSRPLDAIIHAAWYATPGQYLNSPKNLECLEGTIRLAKVAIQIACPHFVGIGTCFEYDLCKKVLTTDTPLRPTSLYGATKAATYLTLSQLFATSTTTFSWHRLFYLFGEGEHESRLVPYLHEQLSKGHRAELTSGQQVRDYLNVKVAAEIIANATLQRISGPINVCSGQPITVRQLAESIADKYGRRDLLNFGARPDNQTDPPIVLGVPSRISQQK